LIAHGPFWYTRRVTGRFCRPVAIEYGNGRVTAAGSFLPCPDLDRASGDVV
jgi:hypothetical protein